MINKGIGVIPTDTVYGFCVNALDKELMKRIYKIKKRDFDKPLILFVKDKREIEKYGVVDEVSKKLIEKFLPGPLTIVLKKTKNSIENSLIKIDTIGIRIPNNDFVIKLLNNLDFPLLTTSANISKEKTPVDLEGLKKLFDNIVDFIVDGGKSGETPSTVIQVIDGNVKILREGVIKKEEIYNLLKE